MTDKEQMLLEALKLARKHLPLSFVDLPDGHFCDVRTLIDEAIDAAEPKNKAADVHAHRKEEAENNNI